MKKIAKQTLFSAILTILMLSFAASVNAATYSATTNEVLNLRSGPGTNYSKTGQLKKGAVITVSEEKNGWVRVGTKKWVMAKYLKKTKVVKAVAPVVAETKLPQKVLVIAAPENISNWAPSDSETPTVTAVSTKPSATINSTSLSTSCLSKIAAANSFCSKIAKGCTSFSTSEKCIDANNQCEARQQEALATCPQAN